MLAPSSTSTYPPLLDGLVKDATLVFDLTADTAWFTRHDVALQISNLVVERKLCSLSCSWKLRLVMHELLRNAIEHGNLGVSSSHKSASLEETSHFYRQVEAALTQPDKAQNPITVSVWQKGLVFIGLVQDSGHGFTPSENTGIGQKLLLGLTTTLTHIHNGSGTVFTLENDSNHD